MKTGIHPDYHRITVRLTSGEELEMHSTWGAEGDTLALDVDPASHPAWTGGRQKLVDTGGRVSKFRARFGADKF